MNRTTLLIIGVLIIAIVGIVFFVQNGGPGGLTTEPVGVEGNPRDIALDFYNDWVDLREATTTSPFQSELINSAIVSDTLRERLVSAEATFLENGFDPVLCGSTIPDSKRSRPILETEDLVQIVIYDKDAELAIQRTFTLSGADSRWQITDIQCSAGEQALTQSEYSFDTTGFLLRDSLPETYNKQYWYIVYESNGQQGFTAPLLFTESSVCVRADGSEGSCSNDNFSEATQVQVQGTMTEAGPEVARLEVVE